MATRFAATNDEYSAATSLGQVANFTMACWGKLTTDRNARSTFMAWDTNATTDWTELQTDSTGTALRFTDKLVNSSGITLTVGTWYYVAAAVSGASGTLYARSATASSWSTQTWSTGQTTHGLASVYVGDNVFNGEWLNGCVQAAKFWTGTLTQNELEIEMWQIMPARTLGLQAWYPLIKPETTDYSGNGRTLATAGAPAAEDSPPVSWSGTRPRRTHVVATAPVRILSAEEGAFTVDKVLNPLTDGAVSYLVTTPPGDRGATFNYVLSGTPVSIPVAAGSTWQEDVSTVDVSTVSDIELVPDPQPEP